jgi:uncharacterized protein (DUF1330 family)
MAQTRLLVTAVAAMIVGFLAGQVHGVRVAAQAGAQSSSLKPAYMVVSSRPVAAEKMAQYRQLAGPLARAAGMEQLAIGDPKTHVLEGTYALDGNLTIEKYRSMDDLLKFWNSPGYRDAQKLRAPLNNINFIVAIEGR